MLRVRNTNRLRVAAPPFASRALFSKVFVCHQGRQRGPFALRPGEPNPTMVKPESPRRGDAGSGRVLGSTLKLTPLALARFLAVSLGLGGHLVPAEIPVACSGVRLLTVCILIDHATPRAPSFLSLLVNRETLPLGINASKLGPTRAHRAPVDGY